ncbi:MAG: zf-HC2 domain-containing protein, partial [Candidatus Hydrogenedentes bacterium]|nr:zf-HC2 domain-containing protein [Candidatus Hydrogenedentota bacterium]
MNCDGVRALMDAYLSNKMEFHEQMDLEIHIGMCEQC